MIKTALYSRNISETKKLVCTTLSRIKDLDISIWAGNRQIDMKRVEEIEQSYASNKYTSIPGIVSVVRIPGSSNVSYQIYDGMHRMKAAQLFYKRIGVDMFIMFSILSDILHIEKDFLDVNKSVPVPSAYFVKDSKIKVCEDIVKYFTTTYPEFHKTTANPRRPNFNPSTFFDKLSSIIITDINSDKIIRHLLDINEVLSIENPDTHDKCKQHKFYLFANDSWIRMLTQRLEPVICAQLL